MGEKGAQWLVTLARLGCTSATSVPLFSHPERYLVTFLVHFHIALGERFWPLFRYFWIHWIFLGDPRDLLRRFWGNFDLGHFWTIFGPEKKRLFFFAEKWHFGPGIRIAGQNHRWGKSV